MKSLILPGLRGHIGDWVYYSTLMELGAIAERVAFAKELHKAKKLSDYIQRKLKTSRQREIARYLTGTDQRFLNAIVVAVYDGDPLWHQLGDVYASVTSPYLSDLSATTRSALGFLELSGSEKLFALDGQHRLSGLQKAVKDDPTIREETSPVLLVAHSTDREGLVRTRRLFTTLNKHARPVTKGQIIALDEDDPIAIVTRLVVENDKRFAGDTIAFGDSNSLGPDDSTALTTLIALYQILEVLLSKLDHRFRSQVLESIKHKSRPEEDVLTGCLELSTRFFKLFAEHFPAINGYFRARNKQRWVARYRNSDGGHILYRPIGIVMFARLIVEYARSQRRLRTAFHRAAQLPQMLTEPGYNKVIWQPVSGTMVVGRKKWSEDFLRMTLGLPVSLRRKRTMAKQYNDMLGTDEGEQPRWTAESLQRYAESGQEP